MISPCGEDRKRSYPEGAASLPHPVLLNGAGESDEREEKRVKGGFQTR